MRPNRLLDRKSAILTSNMKVVKTHGGNLTAEASALAKGLRAFIGEHGKAD